MLGRQGGGARGRETSIDGGADATTRDAANRKDMLCESRRTILNRGQDSGRKISSRDPTAFRRDDENRIRTIFVVVLICPCVPPRLKGLIEILWPPGNSLIEMAAFLIIVPIKIAEEKCQQ